MSQPVAFITGIAGFAGSYLAEELLNHGYRVTGAVYKGETTDHIDGILSDIALTELDIVDDRACQKAVVRFKPDVIFHLAAFASVGKSFASERLVYRINFDGTLNMLGAAIRSRRRTKFVFISSSECYGIFSPRNKTLTENQPLSPVSPYGISKAAAEFACQAYAKRNELSVVIARSFNHSGPRQNEDFVVPSFARQIACLERGKSKPVMLVGDLSVKRDLSDVRDIVRGYRLLAEKGRPSQVYHFCSGRAVSIGSVLNQMLRMAERKIQVRIDKKRLRRNEIPVLRGDNTLAVKSLGYEARHSLSRTLRDTLDYWRTRT
ncbi:MAG: GDP-mannose 4,6-dehydratase [Candidatus Zixiibacteriota bacterium]|nr:MAG: GDP-mannose 4,6-dehydratase [candidate division Zixibacteria bacterium]